MEILIPTNELTEGHNVEKYNLQAVDTYALNKLIQESKGTFNYPSPLKLVTTYQRF